MSKIAKDAFAKQNYHLAVEIFEQCLRENCQQNVLTTNNSTTKLPPPPTTTRTTVTTLLDASTHNLSNNDISIDLYFWYGDSLARCGRLNEAFDVYAFIANRLADRIPLERLNVVTSSLIDYVRINLMPNDVITKTTTTKTSSTSPTTSSSSSPSSTSSSSSVSSTIESALTSGGGGGGGGGGGVTIFSRNLKKSKEEQNIGDVQNGRYKSSMTMTTTTTTTTTSSLSSLSSTSLPTLTSSSLSSILTSTTQSSLLSPSSSKSSSLTSLSTSLSPIASRKITNSVSQLSSALPLAVIDNNNTTITTTASPTINCLTKYKRIEDFDPLLCPVCQDFMRCPVTACCGHSFCRDCCESVNTCHLCCIKFSPTMPFIRTTLNETTNRNNINNNINQSANNNNNNNNNNINNNDTVLHYNNGTNNINNNLSTINNHNLVKSTKYMPDILVRRLVEKWWGADLQAKKFNDTAIHYMSLNLLDDALKYCNESLEKSPNNFESLLLRSEVLYRLGHYQSSLSDAENAMKNRPSSPKAHYQRALALISLGRHEDAVLAQCAAIGTDTSGALTATATFKKDLSKVLQIILNPSIRRIQKSFSIDAPYSITSNERRKRKLVIKASAIDNGLCNYNIDIDFVGEERQNLKQHGSRKHCRRKPHFEMLFYPQTCSRVRTVLDRIQQEIQNLKNIELKKRPHLIEINPTLIDASDFDCILCCRTLWKPVVTRCGHTYCCVCLDRCMDYSTSCPLCMSPLVESHSNVYQGSSSPVPFVLAKRPTTTTTKFLEAAMKRFIPDWYEKRFRQEMDLEPSVPVFICTTAFPSVPCPLFVYEPRYRLMVRRAIESGERQFGIVQPQSGKSRHFDIGTMLDIRDCVLLGDGCSILSTIGCRRFKILTRNEKDGYETAKVEYIYDEIISDENAAFVNDMNDSVLFKAIQWFDSLGTEIKEEIVRSFGPMPTLEDSWETIVDGPAWAWWIIAILPLNQQLKVDILSTTSLEKRLRAIEKTLDYMSGTFRRSQQSCVVVQCEGLQACQAVECCQRSSSSLVPAANEQSTNTNEHPELML